MFPAVNNKKVFALFDIIMSQHLQQTLANIDTKPQPATVNSWSHFAPLIARLNSKQEAKIDTYHRDLKRWIRRLGKKIKQPSHSLIENSDF